MMGVREQKKEALRSTILQNATHIFRDKGYAQATMAHIAECSHTGVGTCYNYFPSKAHLFCECVLFNTYDMESTSAYLNEVASRATSASQAVTDMVNVAFDSVAGLEKGFLQQILLCVMEMFTSDGDGLTPFVKKLIGERYKVIEKCKERGLLAADLDTYETMHCIFSIVAVQLILYAFNEKITLDDFKSSIERKIHLFFQGKECQNGKVVAG